VFSGDNGFYDRHPHAVALRIISQLFFLVLASGSRSVKFSHPSSKL